MTLTLTHSIEKLTFRPLQAVTSTVSPFTLSAQDYLWPGFAWAFDIDLKPILAMESNPLILFATRAGGRVPFIMDYPFARPEVAGVSGITVSGADQAGTNLVTAGWGAGAPVVAAGDFISIGTGLLTRLHQITAVGTNTGGVVTLSIYPAIRVTPDNGAAVDVAVPKVVLKADSAIPVPWGSDHFARVRFSATEAV